MPKTIRAVFENGLFRPIEPVDLPDPCEVEFEPRAAFFAAIAAGLENTQSWPVGAPAMDCRRRSAAAQRAPDAGRPSLHLL
jgi:predicted DNA-binding antitoxin AbrB/MazE fold protein